jgi:hypothetical protein
MGPTTDAAQMGRIDPAATRGRTARRPSWPTTPTPIPQLWNRSRERSLLPSHARGRRDTALTVATASRCERAPRGQPPRRLQGTRCRRLPARDWLSCRARPRGKPRRRSRSRLRSAKLRRQRPLAFYMGYCPHRRKGHVSCGTRDGRTLSRRRRLDRHACSPSRLSHKPLTDSVRRSVMGRPILRAVEGGPKVGREPRQSDESRYVSHQLGAKAFRTPLCNSLA